MTDIYYIQKILLKITNRIYYQLINLPFGTLTIFYHNNIDIIKLINILLILSCQFDRKIKIIKIFQIFEYD